ncbi:hypothetical protein HFP72_19615 [Nocardiopsis sp. ARC36]
MRRLDEGQVAYYRAAHRLNRIWNELQDSPGTGGRDRFSAALSELQNPESWTDAPQITQDYQFHWQWFEVVRELQDIVERL